MLPSFNDRAEGETWTDFVLYILFRRRKAHGNSWLDETLIKKLASTRVFRSSSAVSTACRSTVRHRHLSTIPGIGKDATCCISWRTLNDCITWASCSNFKDLESYYLRISYIFSLTVNFHVRTSIINSPKTFTHTKKKSPKTLGLRF
jgi:hypothetical protein